MLMYNTAKTGKNVVEIKWSYKKRYVIINIIININITGATAKEL